MAEPMRGRWYDGDSSHPHNVLVALHGTVSGPGLRIHELEGQGRTLELTSKQVTWPETWSDKRTPRTLAIDLREHGSLEIDAVEEWKAALAAAGGRPALTQQMQTRWGVFFVVLACAAMLLAAFYRWGTPWAATHVTRQVPLAWETALSQRVLVDLDDGMLKPSRLPAARQAQLRESFDELAKQIPPSLQRYKGYSPRMSLSFRSGLGPNAFALPGGAIVITDALVEVAALQALGDEALAGVLAHEMGHVVHRHATRMLVEQAVLNVGLGLALGDVSSLVSMGGSLLTGLAYRRSHETEADCFAIAMMKRARIPTVPMADLMLAVEAANDAKAAAKAPVAKDGTSKAKASSDDVLARLLSSHPATQLRAEQIKRGQPEGC